MKKELPIQLVETRGDQDLFHKEGFGDNELPAWATDESISQNASAIRSSLHDIESIFDNRISENKEGLPVLMVATLHERATAKSYRANARSIFDVSKKRNVIGMDSQNELLVKIDNIRDLAFIANTVEDTSVNAIGKVKRCGLAAVTNLNKYTAHIDSDIEGSALKIKLADFLDSKLNDISDMVFQRQCRENGINIRKVNSISGMRLYCTDPSTSEGASVLATMDSVISVRKMPYFELSISPEPENTHIDVKIPSSEETYPAVGLLDSGIAPIPHLQQWIKGNEQNIADLDDTDINRRHGTAVAGILNYGDELFGKEITGCSPALITSCIVNTDSGRVKISECEMIEHIKTAIENNPDVKVWNLSQGSTIEITDESFSDFAIELDALQKQYGVLICKSAGNVDPRDPDNNRLSQGADSVRSLVIGSIAHNYVGEGDAKEGHRSPFSRIGPGPECLTKPDLVHYGGNIRTGIFSFSETGFQGASWRGTSFSTPIIASLAANLAYRLNRDFDAILIKALLIHNAYYPDTEGIDVTSIKHELGFGLPSDLNSILNNNENEFTMVWHPSLDSSDLQIQDIPYPSDMVDENGLFYGDITVTVVTDPVLKSSEGNEYCQSDIEVLLQTYDESRYVALNAIGTPKIYRNSDRLVQPKNVLAKGLYSVGSFKSNNREERTLIESAQKYQPVKKYHVNLEKIKPSNRRYITSNRRWCLRINSLYRDATVTERDYDGILETAKAVVVITIKDNRNKGIAYDQCFASLDSHNFVHNNIGIRQNITVHNE